jgi:hypothetical protein
MWEQRWVLEERLGETEGREAFEAAVEELAGHV